MRTDIRCFVCWPFSRSTDSAAQLPDPAAARSHGASGGQPSRESRCEKAAGIFVRVSSSTVEWQMAQIAAIGINWPGRLFVPFCGSFLRAELGTGVSRFGSRSPVPRLSEAPATGKSVGRAGVDDAGCSGWTKKEREKGETSIQQKLRECRIIQIR